eukprot:SAG31_NODE_796_length_12032_cov_21.073242_1_plen_73_part_00
MYGVGPPILTVVSSNTTVILNLKFRLLETRHNTAPEFVNSTIVEHPELDPIADTHTYGVLSNEFVQSFPSLR